MSNLTLKEFDLLDRLLSKPELEPFFFRDVKGLKWFDELFISGYFDSNKNPEPVAAEQKGHFRIPTWHAINYLVTIAPELQNSKNEIYAKKTLEILWSVSGDAKKRKMSNYRTWWKFSLILCEIPVELIQPSDVQNHLPYWLQDHFGRELAGEVFGETWLPKLLENTDSHSHELALSLIKVIYEFRFVEKDFMGKMRKEAKLPIEKHHLEKITQNIRKAGEVIGRSSVEFFIENLRQCVITLENDSYCSIWRSAVEEHPQNEHKDAELGTIVVCVRDAIEGLLVSDLDSAKSIVGDLLIDELQMFRRIGIYFVDAHFSDLSHLSDRVLIEEHFIPNMRHEVWNYLNHHYNHLPQDQQDRVLNFITSIEREDDDGKPHPGFSAYAQAVWLAAIRSHDSKLEKLYKEKCGIADAEPDHPDFSSYMWSGGFRGIKSPLSQEEILSLSVNELVSFLDEYETEDAFEGPSIEGLASTLRVSIKDHPLHYIRDLDAFKSTKASYLNAIIEGYGEAWKAKQKLPWKDIWERLLDFILALVQPEEFWILEDEAPRGTAQANRNWLVNSIGRLLESGLKDDEWAFDSSLLPNAKKLLLLLLEKQNGSDSFETDRDAVSIAINSPRGNCLEALINYGLRRCRLSDKEHGNHDLVWQELEPIFANELNTEPVVGYEFSTLVANYLRNFMYMSMGWTKRMLPKIFDKTDNLRWSCAMEGLAYVGTLHDDIYCYLRDNGDFIQALDQDSLREYVHERTVQSIGIAYLRDLESLDEPQSLISQLLSRHNSKELGILIGFFSPFEKEIDPVIREKSMALWPRILKVLDIETVEGKKLASRLCRWLGFIEEINNSNRNLIYESVEFAGADYHAYDTLKQIARLSRSQPLEAGKLWMIMLKGTSEDYPQEAIQEALQNLINEGREGKRLADTICSEYIKLGTDRPNQWRHEIIRVKGSACDV